ncbi:glycosyltransferase [Polycladidibacter hongkongensis]|uniref:glycosyltransferase n=1 Tax=Polycladidibacter hongkongensis TaxID=1647556 RepID=UPI000AF482B4|nr:glycosyltransferase [Pseudovibrio hongkongensis]
MLLTDLLVIIFLVSQSAFLFAAYVFFASGVDDLFIDGLFYLKVNKDTGVAAKRTEDQLLKATGSPPISPMAIMLPAWDEANILVPAVTNMMETLDYPSYHVFLGVYPNDPETIAAANRLKEKDHRIHVVTTSHPGPTCKADCVNQILSAIIAFETEHAIVFKGVVMQDAEDVLNPRLLHICNAALENYDVIQVPVLSLPRRRRDIVGCHYMDEFAEFHSKEAVVREYLSHTVSGAGVGTCFSRRAIIIAREQFGTVFNTSSLTEDYDFSMRMHSHGIRHHMLWLTSKVPGRTTKYAATQELFPNRFWASVRQKTRWTIGIAFQGWSQLGWKGTWAQRYFFWRDRKMIFFSHAILIGYFAILLYLGLWIYSALDPFAYQVPPLLREDHPLWIVIWFNLFLLLHRLVQRSIFTWFHYGKRYLPLIVVRYFLAILINYVAMIRATRIWLRHKRTGETIGWDKTTHDFEGELNDKEAQT